MAIKQYIFREIKKKIFFFSSKANKKYRYTQKEDLNSKIKRKKKKNEDYIIDYNNLNFKFLYNPIQLYYGSFLKWFLAPYFLGSIISFFGGYLFFKLNFIYGISIILFSFFFVLFVNSLDNKYSIFPKIKLQKLDKNFYEYTDQLWFTKDELISLQTSLPWYLSEAEIESSTWLNSIIKSIWNQMKFQFDNYLVKEYGVNKSLDSLIGKGNKYLNLKIKRSDLGDESPYISGIRIVDRNIKKEDAILECEITFNSNLNFEIKGNYSIYLKLCKFYLKAKLRMIASPLFREIPAVGSITFNLIEKPKIDWEIKGFLSFLNANFIKKLTEQLFNFWLGQPLKTKLNIAKFLPIRELKLRDPIGLYKIDIIEAVNLPKSQLKVFCSSKKPDSYCLIELDNAEKITKVKQDTDNPEWNQTFLFYIFKEMKNSIEIYIYDEYQEEDELIGFINLPTENLKSKILNLNGRELELCLLDPENKKPLKLGQTKIVFKATWFCLTRDFMQIKKSSLFSKSLLPVAVLSVLVDSASGLETVFHQFQTPELRTLVRISVGNQVHITTIKERTGYPVWEEVLNFLLYNPKLEDVFIEVVDMYWIMEKRYLFVLGGKKNKINDEILDLSQNGLVLGYTKIKTAEVLKNFEMRKQGTFQLEGYSEDAFIRLLLTIRLIEFSDNVAKNLSLPRISYAEYQTKIN